MVPPPPPPPPPPPRRKGVRFELPGTAQKKAATNVKKKPAPKKTLKNGKAVPPPPPPPRRNLKQAKAPPPPPPPPPKTTSAPKTPAPAKSNIIPKPPPVVISPEEMPRAAVAHYASPQQSNKRVQFADMAALPVADTGAMTLLMSPMSALTVDCCAAVSSPHNNNNNKTLDSIDMLNFEYIEHCESLHDLQRVVTLLCDSGSKSPRLLTAARERLVALEQRQSGSVPPPRQDAAKVTFSNLPNIIEPADEVEEGNVDFGQEAVNLSRITAANTTLDSIDPSKSTLNFSLSPSSTLQGVNLVETPTFPEHLFQFSTGAGRLGPIPESPAREEMRPSRKETPPRYQVRANAPTHRDTTADKAKFQKTISDLRQQLDTTVEEAKFQKVISELRQQLEKAKSETVQYKAEVDKTKEEHDDTRKTLDMTRAAICKRDQENRKLEARLEKKISELSQTLANTAERSRLVVGAERTLRTQCEEELSKQNRKNVVLNQELRETRDNLEQIKKRHLQFRLELMKVAGIPKAELKGLSQHEFVASLSNKIKTLQQQNESMSKTLAQAKQAITERRGMETKLSEAVTSNERLEAENFRLSEKIRELRAEVKSSRAYIDKLLKTSHETKEDEWEKQEEQYKCVIQNLRHQIRQQESTISMDLYKSAVEENRHQLTQLRVAENTVVKLHEKIAVLEREKASVSKPAATPRSALSAAKTRRSVMFSPTDRLERGLLDHYIPASAVKSPMDAPLPAIVSKPARTPKSTRSKPTAKEKKAGDLTGITISFDNALSPRTPAGMFQKRTLGNKASNLKPSRVLQEVSANNSGTQGNALTSPSWSTAKVQQQATTAKGNSSEVNNVAYPVPEFGKKNGAKTPKTPRSASKEVRERFGGPRALHDKLKKMRSPKLTKPLSVMPMRDVQIIIH